MTWRDRLDDRVDRCPSCDGPRWDRNCRRCGETTTEESSMTEAFTEARAAVITQAFIEHVIDVGMARALQEFEVTLGAAPDARDQALMRHAMGVGAAQAMLELHGLAQHMVAQR